MNLEKSDEISYRFPLFVIEWALVICAFVAGILALFSRRKRLKEKVRQFTRRNSVDKGISQPSPELTLSEHKF